MASPARDRRRCAAPWISRGPAASPPGPNPAGGLRHPGRRGGTSSREGYARGAGGRHAEVVALARPRRAGHAVRTAVVTLEPCNHTGRTGPCTEALIAAGVGRVVFAQSDPNPVARGRCARPCGRRASTSRAACWPTDARAVQPDVDVRRRARSPVRHLEVRRHPRRPQRRRRRLQPVDHLGRCRASRRPPPARRVRRGPRRHRHRPGRRPASHRARRRRHRRRRGRCSRCASVDGAAAHRPPVPPCSTTRPTPSHLATRRDPAEALAARCSVRDRQHVWLEGGPTLAGGVRPGRAGRPDRAYLAPALLGAGRAGAGRTPVSRRSTDAVRLDVDDVTRIGPGPRGSPHRTGRRDDRRCSPESSRSWASRRRRSARRMPPGCTVRGPTVTTDAVPGDSIAVNGVCLTVVDAADGAFTADVMRETLRPVRPGATSARWPGQPRTGRPRRRTGSAGTSCRATSTASARCSSRTPGDRWEVVRIGLPDDWRATSSRRARSPSTACRSRSSEVGDGWFEVSLIPTTLSSTTSGAVRSVTAVNLEVDVIAKYVERLLDGRVA